MYSSQFESEDPAASQSADYEMDNEWDNLSSGLSVPVFSTLKNELFNSPVVLSGYILFMQILKIVLTL